MENYDTPRRMFEHDLETNFTYRLDRVDAKDKIKYLRGRISNIQSNNPLLDENPAKRALINYFQVKYDKLIIAYLQGKKPLKTVEQLIDWMNKKRNECVDKGIL